MKLLIRYINKQGQGEVSEQVVHNNNVLSIGRGTNQNILLSDPKVALNHAKITIQDNAGKVSASLGKYVIKNNEVVKKCTLIVGEEIEISGHKIALLPTESNYDLVVLVSVNVIEQAALQKRYQLNFNDINMSKRSWSWTLFLSITLLCLVLPVIGLISPSWMDTLRQSPLPSDSQWSAGDLIKPHKFMGDDCAQCHTELFVPTSNETCQSCHSTVGRHVSDIALSASVNEETQCASCHKEHNPQQTLADYSQQMCVDCHVDSIEILMVNGDQNTQSAHAKLDRATDFEHDHPAFNVSVLTAVTDNEKSIKNIIDWQPKRIALTDNKSSEESNLKFSHQLHMDPAGIKSATGDVTLVCADCHVAESNGREMQPITMEKNCQSCHALTFDVDDPMRVVPHGSPDEVLLMMREYYAFRYIYKNLNKDATQADIVKAGDLFTVRDARRPGRDKGLRKDFEHSLNENTIASIEKLTKDTIRTDALVWAESRAYVAATDIFERQACDVCHVVTKDSNAELPWQVQPVKLTRQWLPAAKFPHDAHQTNECETCHAASSSELSNDILMPDIENCQQCHGSENSKNLIPNTCIDCHNFHDTQTHTLGSASKVGASNGVGHFLQHNSLNHSKSPFTYQPVATSTEGKVEAIKDEE
ncbi:cytochrome c3 family protein [Colwellia echini]|uniref:Tetrahaem cytochrome domain-containing protein n=1 Tax=Colwellia echini TaxID=1982103 RepID=A0ABY3MZ67_9GAMM|nr:cytochrome c3 family protein [Colwellia echini]TYK66292.1 hypothetical protein CWS31_006780 [Colwellia echini]